MTEQATVYELRIVRGLPKVPNDTLSAEDGLTTINFLANTTTGFIVDTDGGYIPKRPTLKNGGLWADSGLEDGRILISSADTNVIETIKCTLKAESLVSINALMRQLEFMIDSVSDFWTTNDQTEPVYLMHQVPGEPGARYALLYNIEVTYDDPDMLEQPQRDVTISIEREPYWRPIPPGANPKMWAFYYRDGNFRNFNTASASLVTGSDHFQTETIQNRREWNTTQTGIISHNYLDIPAENIPGDAPALVCMNVAITLTGVGNPVTGAVHVANVITPTTLPIRSSGNRSVYNMLNAGDSSALSNFTLSNNASYPISDSLAVGRVATSTAATATITWRNAEDVLDIASFRGTYAVFLRASLLASTYTLTLETSLDGSINFPQQQVVATGVTGSSISVLYIGRISIPAVNRTIVDPGGNGVLVPTAANSNLAIRVTCARTSGADNIAVSDLILVPVDRQYTRVLPTVNGTVDTGANMLLDNTGYLDHGASEYQAVGLQTGSSTAFTQNPEPQGSLPFLYPGYDNRIYFLFEQSSHVSLIADSAIVRLNIIPRWTGLRDR